MKFEVIFMIWPQKDTNNPLRLIMMDYCFKLETGYSNGGNFIQISTNQTCKVTSKE